MGEDSPANRLQPAPHPPREEGRGTGTTGVVLRDMADGEGRAARAAVCVERACTRTHVRARSKLKKVKL